MTFPLASLLYHDARESFGRVSAVPEWKLMQMLNGPGLLIELGQTGQVLIGHCVRPAVARVRVHDGTRAAVVVDADRVAEFVRGDRLVIETARTAIAAGQAEEMPGCFEEVHVELEHDLRPFGVPEVGHRDRAAARSVAEENGVLPVVRRRGLFGRSGVA